MFKLEENFLQGDTWGPLAATAQMDTIPEDWIKNPENEKYIYKEEVPLNILGQIDDLVGITKDGPDVLNLMHSLILNPGRRICSLVQENVKKYILVNLTQSPQ